MIARVSTIRTHQGGLARVIETCRADELPVLRQASGFAGIIVLASLTDAATGERAEVVTLWESVPALDAFETGSNQQALTARLGPLRSTPIELRRCEVAQAAGMTGGTVARFISARLHPGNIDTVVSLFENVVMHAATQQQGFRRGLLLVDRAADHVISIGLWHSEAALHASEQTGYLGQQIGNFTQIVAEPIVPEMLSVAVEA